MRDHHNPGPEWEQRKKKWKRRANEEKCVILTRLRFELGVV